MMAEVSGGLLAFSEHRWQHLHTVGVAGSDRGASHTAGQQRGKRAPRQIGVLAFSHFFRSFWSAVLSRNLL